MKRIKIYSNKQMTIMGPMVTLIGLVGWLWLFYIFGLGNYSGERINPIITFLYLSIASLGFWGWFIFYPQWFASIILDENLITTKCGRKKHSEPYSKYHHVYIADYYHYGFRPCFIVISKNKVAKDSLSHINIVPVDENIIKIRYSKKNFKILMEILPEPLHSKLEEAIETAGRKVY